MDCVTLPYTTHAFSTHCESDASDYFRKANLRITDSKGILRYIFNKSFRPGAKFGRPLK